jgi:tetratricopeptide (TPR) repeat protein
MLRTGSLSHVIWRAIITLSAIAWICLAAHPVAAQDSGVLPPAGGAAQEAADKAFDEGNKALAEERYAEASAYYQKALATLPNDPDLLWNAGLAAYLGKDYPTALTLWQRLKGLAPDDGKVRAKLIQVYQAQGNTQGRAEEREALVALRKSGKDPELKKRPSFCCDQFAVKGKKVFAYDFFELTGKWAMRYDFIVLKPDGTADFHLSLESDQLDNDLAHQLGEIKPNERLFL